MAQQKKTRSELKREAIIEAALSAFKDGGIKGTSMDNIAALANVSKRTVYNHFDSKEKLVMFLINKLWQQSLVDIDIKYDPRQPMAKQLSELLASQVGLLSSQHYIDMSRIAFNHFFNHPEELKEAAAKFNAQESALKRWIREAARDNKLDIASDNSEDIETALTQLHNLTKGSCFWPQMMGYGEVLNNAQQSKLIDNTVSLFLGRYQKS